MLCSSFDANEFIESLNRFSDYEQIVPSQGEWLVTQETSLDFSSIFCSNSAKMDFNKLPPTYDQHINHMTSTDKYARTASPSGSDASVDLSISDEVTDQNSSLLNDILECIQHVDSQEKTSGKIQECHTGKIYRLSDFGWGWSSRRKVKKSSFNDQELIQNIGKEVCVHTFTALHGDIEWTQITPIKPCHKILIRFFLPISQAFLPRHEQQTP